MTTHLKNYLVAALLMGSVMASELPLPEELIGSKTVLIVSVDVGGIQEKQMLDSLKALLGQAPDPKPLEAAWKLQKEFTEAGGTTICVAGEVPKNNASPSALLVVGKSDDAPAGKLAAFINGLSPEMATKFSPDSPKEIGGFLVWRPKDYPMPKADEKRAKSFGDAFDELFDDEPVQIVGVPDDESVAAAEAGLKGTSPENIEISLAFLKASGICLSTDFGAAEEPALSLTVISADAAGAKTVADATNKLVEGLKKDCPPELKEPLGNLKADLQENVTRVVVQMADLAKVVKFFSAAIGPLLQPAPATK